MKNYQKVFIVAGHGGGSDVGARAYDGTTEREIARAVSQMVIDKLEGREIEVGVNSSISLPQKIETVNANCRRLKLNSSNSLLVSIHVDYSGASEGVGAYHYAGSQDSIDFAQNIIEKIAQVGNRKVKFNKPDTLSNHGRLGIVRDTIPLAVLIEIGTLKANGNVMNGLELLKSEEGKKQIAQKIVEGIYEYAGWEQQQQPETSIKQDLGQLLLHQKKMYEIGKNQVKDEAAKSGLIIRDIQRKIGLPVSE